MSSKTELPLLLDQKTFSAHYGVCRAMFYRLVNQADVPSVQIGKRKFIDRVQFDAWLHNQSKKVYDSNSI